MNWLVNRINSEMKIDLKEDDYMRKIKEKVARRFVIGLLAMGIFLMGSLLFMSLNKIDQPTSQESVAVVEEKEPKEVVVEKIIPSEDDKVYISEKPSIIDSDIPDIIEPKVITESKIMGDEVVTEESIQVPMAPEPVVSEVVEPEIIPATDSDLTNPDVVPTYSEEQVTYVPEPEPQMVEEVETTSNLVPDSENPFLQPDIPTNGDRGEVRIEDVSDYVPGTGDKF